CVQTGSGVLSHIHGMAGSGTEDVVRIYITDMRLALWPGAQLKEITEGTIATLPTYHCLDAAAMDMVAAGPNRHSEAWRGAVRVCALNHPETPQPVDRIRPIDVFPLGWRQGVHPAGRVVRITQRRRAIPGDVDSA